MTDRLLCRIAWMLPRRLVYWCAIRLMSAATVGRYSNQVVPELYAVDALQRWDRHPLSEYPCGDPECCEAPSDD